MPLYESECANKEILLQKSFATMLNALIIGGPINVWGGTSCNSRRSFNIDSRGEKKPRTLAVAPIKYQSSPPVEE